MKPAVRLIDTSGAGSTASTQKILVRGAGPAAVADASILLLRHQRAGDETPAAPVRHRSALTVGVLARVDELGAIDSTGEGMELAERASAEWATRAEVRRRCSVVVPVAGLLAAGAASLTDAQYQALRRLAIRNQPVRRTLRSGHGCPSCRLRARNRWRAARGGDRPCSTRTRCCARRRAHTPPTSTESLRGPATQRTPPKARRTATY